MADDLTSSPVADPPRMELYLAEARWRRDDQVRRISVLNQKLVTTLTLNTAIVAVLGAVLALAEPEAPIAAVGTFVSTVVLFAAVVGLSAMGYRGSRWMRRPDLITLRDHLVSYRHETVEEWTADEIVAALAANEPLVQRKGRLFSWALIFTVANAILAGATVALTFFA